MSTDQAFCSSCGKPRMVGAAFCPSCGAPYVPTSSQPVTGAPPQMRNVGMLPSTRYKLFALWLALIVVGEIYVFSVNVSGADLFWGFAWFVGLTIVYIIIASIWGGIRQAQVNLEYERWLKNQRKP